MTEPTRKLAAIMFTDLVGYTALMEKDEHRALKLLQKNREVQKPLIEKHGGTWLKEIGDGTLSSFPSAIDAVNCSIEIQRMLKWDPQHNLRIGIHVGDVVFEKGDVFGAGVNMASRLESLAEPGGICVSGRVHDDIKNKPDIDAVFLGEKELKNVDHPVKVYALMGEGLAEPGATDVSVKTEDRHLEEFISREKVTRLPHISKPSFIRKWISVGFVIIIALAAALWYYRTGEYSGETAIKAKRKIGKKSIAVLYLENMSTDKESDVWRAGMTEAIITALAKLGKFDVKSRTEVLHYKDRAVDYNEIRENLGVDVFLEGSLQKMGNTLRINAQLIDTQSGFHIWAEKYDRPAEDIFAVQDEISREIVKALGETLEGIEAEVLQAQPTTNLKAFEFATQGIYYYDRKMYDMALAAFDSALVVDSGYSRAHFYKAQAYQEIGEYEQAKIAYKKALFKARKFNRILWERTIEEEGLPPLWTHDEDKLIAAGLVRNEENQRGTLFCIDLVTHKMLWKTLIRHSYPLFVRRPFILGNEVLISSISILRTQTREATVYAYDIGSGKQIFKREFPRMHLDERISPFFINIEGYSDTASPSESKQPLVLFVYKTDKSEIHRLDRKTGKSLWNFEYDSPGWYWPQVSVVEDESSDNLLLINHHKGKYRLVNALNGAPVWELDTDDQNRLFVSQENIISVFIDSTLVTAISAQDSIKIWGYHTEVPIKQEIHLPKKNLLILQLKGGTLLALNTEKRFFGIGQRKWETSLDEDQYKFYYDTESDEKVERIYALSGNGVIHVIDVETGKVLGRTTLDKDNIRLRVFKEAVIGASTNHVFRLSPDSGEILWQVRDNSNEKSTDIISGNVIVYRSPNAVVAHDLQSGDFLWSLQTEPDYKLYGFKDKKKEQLFVGLKDRLVEINLQENPEARLIEEKDILIGLATCATELNLYQEAEGYLTEVVETIDPGYSQGYWSLANIYQKSGKNTETMRVLMRYYALFPRGSPESVKTEKRLHEDAGLQWIVKMNHSWIVDGNEMFFIREWHWQQPVELSALNRKTGDILWSNTFYQNIELSEWAQNDDAVFATGLDQADDTHWIARLIQKSTGKTVWEKTIISEKEDKPVFPVAIYKDHVFLKYGNQSEISLMALTIAKGEIAWKKTWKGVNIWSRVVVLLNNSIAVGVKDTVLFLDPSSGNILWMYHVDNSIEVETLEKAGLQGYKFVFTTKDNHYVCLDLNQRKRLWKFKSPVITEGYYAGVVHIWDDTITDWGVNLFAFRYDSTSDKGVKLLWSINPGGNIRSVSWDSKSMYVGLDDNELVRIDKTTGAIQKRFQLLWNYPEILGSRYPLIKDSTAIYASRNYVYALKLDR